MKKFFKAMAVVMLTLSVCGVFTGCADNTENVCEAKLLANNDELNSKICGFTRQEYKTMIDFDNGFYRIEGVVEHHPYDHKLDKVKIDIYEGLSDVVLIEDFVSIDEILEATPVEIIHSI